MFKKIIFFHLIMSCICYAGYEVGNGGVAVVCKNKNGDVSNVELLDIFELRQRMDLSREEFEEKSRDKMNWITRVYTESSRRGTLYTYYYRNFYMETVFQSEKLSLTNDSGQVIPLPKECELEQLVFQTSKAHPFDSIQWEGRYKINSILWEKMSELNRQATILHEIIYRERINQCIHFAEKGCFPEKFNLNSEAVRKLVGHYFSDDFEHSTPSYINHLYQSVGFRRFESQGVVFVDKAADGLTMIYDENGIITILLDEMLKKDQSGSSPNGFFVNDYFDSSFRDTKYFTKVKLRIKDFEILLNPNFKVKIDFEKVSISEGTEILSSVVLSNTFTGIQKEYSKIKEIQIDKMGIVSLFQ